jgi:ketosteroid isomerase-like protein
MADLIGPPVARRPEEALELVAQALSDGDLEAALAQYEKGALLACWPGGDGSYRAAMNGDRDVGQALARVMALRLPLSVRVVIVLESPELTLVVCERRIAGTDPDGEPVRLTGHGCAMLRPQPDGSWRIAADAWHAGPEASPGSAEIRPAAGRPGRTRHGSFG